MTNSLSDLGVGHAYAPNISNFVNTIEFGTSDPTAATLIVSLAVLLGAYTMMWRALTS